jgi:hypothetical protein
VDIDVASGVKLFKILDKSKIKVDKPEFDVNKGVICIVINIRQGNFFFPKAMGLYSSSGRNG